MPRTRSSIGSASRISNSNRDNDIFSLSMQHDDLAYYVRNKLSRDERLVVMLRYAEELPFDEIAGIMSMPQDQVESIHKQIVNRLQRSLRTKRRNNRGLCLAGV